MLDIQLARRQGHFQVDAAFQTRNTGITALFGPSGAGKTSVINMVAGLSRPDKGRIVVQTGFFSIPTTVSTCLLKSAPSVIFFRTVVCSRT